MDVKAEIGLLTGLTEKIDPALPQDIKEIAEGKFNNYIPPQLNELLLKSNDIQETVLQSIEAESVTFDLWLSAGIKSLMYFVQYNWTGPFDNDNEDLFSSRRKEALNDLSLHDECTQNVKRPELLYLAKKIFSCEPLQFAYKSCVWWLFRATLLQQYILEEVSGKLFEQIEQMIEKINNIDIMNDAYCKILFNLEAAQFYLYYRRVQNSDKHIEIALNTAMLKLDLQGIMGKRTKYQQEEKAQLYLNVSLDKDPFPSKVCQDLPKSLDLNDDLRLEHIQYSEPIKTTQLGSLEEAIILSKFMQLQLSQPKDKLVDEEITPYLCNVIEHTQNWPLKVTSLYHRCLLEGNHKRTVERAMMQIEHLIKEINNSVASVVDRTNSFFASGLRPIWEFEQIWADFMLNLGLVKGALDVYIKLGLWEEVIVCYNILELKHKAAEIIRQELSKKPTVKLWCLLGDATQDIEHYKTAWTLAEEKSSRVQRHWGNFYYAKRNYAEAVPHLKLSLELNNLQEKLWLRLGYAALETEDWKLAVMAYKRYCALEPTTFEAWNNLGKAYIKLGDKPKAWKSFQDAIKCNFNRWELWENLMLVSIDLGHFSEVLQCYHRLLDIKERHVDVQILEILSNGILKNIKDIDGNPCRGLLQKTTELFGRITSSERSDSNVWRMYGELAALKKTDVDDQIAAQYLQHAYRTAVSNAYWSRETEATLGVLKLCERLAEAYMQCASDRTVAAKRRLLSSARLSLKSVIKTVEEQGWSHEEIVLRLSEVKKLLDTIQCELDSLAGGMV